MSSTGNPMCQKVEPRLWEPVWLWRTTLAAFMVGFTGMWAGLIAVWRYDINNDGYSIPAGAGSSYHYIWTYGPTAILTVVNSLWGKIDYCCKITQPWKEMQNHLADSSKSVQLDYISPFVTTSFYRAVKNRHFAVAASVLGLVILKVIMVASAALLVPSPTEFFRVWPVNLTTKFDGSGFLKAVHGLEGPGAFITTGDSVSQSYFSDSGMAGPLFVFHGLFNASLPYPLGTQKDLAYQLIASPEFGGNATSISAPVAAFIPNTTCERAQVHFSDSSYYWVNMTLNSPTCSAGYFSTGQIMPTCAKGCGIANQSWVDSYSVLRVNCSEDKTFISGVQIPLDNQLKDDLRFAFVAANFSWSLNSSTTGTAAVCKFDYGIRNATLEQGFLTNTIKLELSGDTGNAYKLSNLTSLQLAEFIYTTAWATEYSLTPIDGFGTQLADPLSAVAVWTLEGPIDVTHKLYRLFDVDTLAEAARITLDGLAIQLMHQFFLVPDPDSTTVNGTIKYSEQRIHVQPISLWLMVTRVLLLV
ncbi:hypothetical protein NUW58_g4015 [Xylaria curta]|uniref:Uncharacterized protein n=1 Tax=Xylaria curta TaxID=42375 RepID=A0ACC1P891_9PEZI|nr:hypothetical protein NUW58_g4015 [Xylaria curta]